MSKTKTSTGTKVYLLFSIILSIFFVLFLFLYLNYNSLKETATNIANSPAIILIIDIIIGLLCAFFWYKFLESIKMYLKTKKVLKIGKITTATFLNSKLFSKINKNPLFNIAFTYKNENGETIEFVSKQPYTAKETMMLKTLETFDIKYHKNFALIITNPNSKQPKAKITKKTKAVKTCKYCGSTLKQNQTKCNNCNAQN